MCALIGVMFIGSFGGCRGPKPDRTSVKGTFALYMGISARGNYDALYPLLVSQLQEKIAAAHTNMRECVRLIEDRFPDRIRASALEAVGSPEVRSSRTPDRYLAALMDAAGRPALDIRDRLASKIKWINEVVPGTFKVTTVSGATLQFVRGGDRRFYLVPTQHDVGLIQHGYKTSLQRLEAARKTVESLDNEK